MSEDSPEYTLGQPTGVAALLVTRKEIRRIFIEGDGAEDIHALVGNWFTTAFRVEGHERGSIDAYCDDEFLLRDPEERADKWEAVLEPGTLYRTSDPLGYPIGSPIVICGNNIEGESRSLTESEMASFFLDFERGQLTGRDDNLYVVPMLCYRDNRRN